MEVVSAQALDVGRLTRLFNDGFSDYLRPVSLDEAGFAEHLAHNDIDLAGSRVVMVANEPAGFALAARRGSEAWIGGMGTVPEHRRQGVGELALSSTIAAASEAGCVTVWLEVILENEQAAGLYEKLGFEVTRDLIVWSLPATGRPLPAHGEGDERSAQVWIASRRPSREPWQRADASLRRMRASGWRTRAVTVPGSGDLAAALLVRDGDATVHVLQGAAESEAAAAEAVLAAAGSERSLRFANAPADEVFSAALQELGADPIVRQHEMRLRLG